MARKSADERRLEHITWALLFWVLGAQIALELPDWITSLGGGLILLGSAAQQRARGWRISPVTVLGGFALLGLGIGAMGEILEVSVIPFTLLIFGAVIFLNMISGET